MSLYNRPNSSVWWCRFQVGGREYRKSTGTSDKRKAEQFERKWRAELEAQPQEGTVSTAPAPLRPTLAVIRDWDVRRARAEQRHEGYIKLGIMQNWKSLISFFEEPDQVTEDSLLEYVRLRKSQGVRGQTIAKELVTLKRGMQRARREFGIPVPEVWPKVRRDDKDEDKAGEYHGEATLRWLEQLKEVPRATALFTLLTGVRASELRRIDPSWVCAAPPRCGVRSVLKLPAWATKNRRARDVPLCETALAALRFAPFKADRKKAFGTAARRVGLKNVSLRDLRHTFATVADATVKDRTAVDMVMGHSAGMEANRNIPMVYQHAAISRLAPLVLAVEAWVVGTPAAHIEYPENPVQ